MTTQSRSLAAGCLLLLLLSFTACGSGEGPAEEPAGDAAAADGGVPVAAEGAAEPELASDEDKTFYALGLVIAGNIGAFDVDERELALIQQGMADAVFDREPKVDLAEYGPKLQGLAQERASRVAAGEAQAAGDFLESAAAEPGAERTDSGLIITELAAGTGDSPAATDRVRVHYHGTLRDGKVFDSSVDRGEPVTFALNAVVPCWTEGLQRMKVGGKSRLVCPAELAYGEQGRPPQIPPGAALAFDVELLEIVK